MSSEIRVEMLPQLNHAGSSKILAPAVSIKRISSSAHAGYAFESTDGLNMLWGRWRRQAWRCLMT
jgi:hypothetical protein